MNFLRSTIIHTAVFIPVFTISDLYAADTSSSTPWGLYGWLALWLGFIIFGVLKKMSAIVSIGGGLIASLIVVMGVVFFMGEFSDSPSTTQSSQPPPAQEVSQQPSAEYDMKKGNRDHEYTLKFANGGSVQAQVDVAFQFMSGFLIDKNPKKAGYWYTKAAGQGSATAQLSVGVAYCEGPDYIMWGIDVPLDFKKGESYLQSAFILGGLESAALMMATCAKKQGHTTKYLAWLGAAKNLGVEHADTLLSLAVMEYPGSGGTFWAFADQFTQNYRNANPE